MQRPSIAVFMMLTGLSSETEERNSKLEAFGDNLNALVQHVRVMQLSFRQVEVGELNTTQFQANNQYLNIHKYEQAPACRALKIQW